MKTSFGRGAEGFYAALFVPIFTSASVSAQNMFRKVSDYDDGETDIAIYRRPI